MTTIVLAEDHNVVRQALRLLIESADDFSVIGESSDGLDAGNIVERLQPDILVLDIMLPGLNGLEVMLRVRRRSPETRVIVLSMYSDEAYILQALRNGAHGYVLKEASADELLNAIREVSEGHRYLSPPLSERAIEAYIQRAQEETEPYLALTEREREVLQLAAEGNSNPQIADRLSISPRTVETHRANLMQKLDLRNQTDIVRYAIRRGILPIDK